MVISDVSISMEIISNHTDTVVPSLACSAALAMTGQWGHIIYDDEV